MSKMMGNADDLDGVVTDALCSATSKSVSERRPLDANDVLEIAESSAERQALGISSDEITGKVSQLEAAGVFAEEGHGNIAVRYLEACHTFGFP